MEQTVKLFLGKDLAEILVKNEAIHLTDSIKELRKKNGGYIIPPVYITDEVKTAKDSYEIHIADKIILKERIPDNREENALIDKITKNLDKLCKEYISLI